MRGKRNAGVVAAALVLCLSANSWGQSVFKDDFPGDWGAPTFPPAPPSPGSVSGNVPADQIHSGTFYDGASPTAEGLTLLGYEAKVIEDNVGPTDAFRVRISQEQSFTLHEEAMVAIPMFLKGSITFKGPAFSTPPPSNLAYGEATGSATIYDSAGGAVLSISHMVSGSKPTGDIPDFDSFNFIQTTTPLAAGTYRLRATLEIAGEGGSSSSKKDAEADVDFFDNSPDHQRQGLAVSLAAWKDGLGNSRQAVNAPAARDRGGVDGTGVKIGIVEAGEAYKSHSSLPGITWVEPDSPVPGDHRSEHTLAVAGILAANTGDGSATGNNGVAPGASLYSIPTAMFGGASTAIPALLRKHPDINVINMSSDSDMAVGTMNRFVNDHSNVTVVKSAGNHGNKPGNTISEPGMAENVITVGGLNRSFDGREKFSSTSDGENPIKPDIVAPGEYINIPVSRDINGDGLVNDFHRVFLGDDFDKLAGVTVGDASGTSFAAPHVAGAAALLIQYATDHSAHHAQDHRVIKAILLNDASTGVKHLDGGAWTQAHSGDGSPAAPMLVTQSLDRELGAGMLDALESMNHFLADEISDSHANSAAHLLIDTTIPGPTRNEGRFWDLEKVLSDEGTVDYLLGDIQGRHLRATLTWDAISTTLQPLEMRLYHEGSDPLNPPGFDPADVLLAATDGPGENVKLFDFELPPFAPSAHPGYYLQVINKGTLGVDYALAVTVVPEPRVVVLLFLVIPLRRRMKVSRGSVGCEHAEHAVFSSCSAGG